MRLQGIPAETSIRRQLAKGISWNVVSVAFLQGSTLIVNVVLANLLGRQHFGQFAIINSTLLTLAGVAQMATGITAAKYVAQYRVSHKETAGKILGLCTIVTLVTGIVCSGVLLTRAEWVSARVLNAPQLATELAIASGIALFLTMNAYQVGALAGFEAFRSSAMLSSMLGVLHIALCAFGAWRFGLTGAVSAFLASSGIRFAAFSFVLRAEETRAGIRTDLFGWGNQSDVLLRFTFPAAICGLSSMPALWMANVILARQDGGYEQLALYSAAYQLKTIVVLLPATFSTVAVSLLNYQSGLGNVEGYRKVFWDNLAVSGGVVLVGAALIAGLGHWLLKLYGNGFSHAYPALLILLLSAVFEGFGIGMFQAVQSQGRMWSALFFIVLPRDILIVVLAFLLVPKYGFIGLAVAYSCAWIVGSVLTGLYAYLIGPSVFAGLRAPR